MFSKFNTFYFLKLYIKKIIELNWYFLFFYYFFNVHGKRKKIIIIYSFIYLKYIQDQFEK